MGKRGYMNKKRLLASSMNLDLKKTNVHCTVWSVALYGAET